MHPQAVLGLTDVVLPLHHVDFLVEIRTADQTARVDGVDRRVGAVGFARQLGEFRREIRGGELVALVRSNGLVSDDELPLPSPLLG